MSEVIHSQPAHKRLWDQFRDRRYRHGYALGFVGDFVAAQIAALRRQRGWNQSELASHAGVSQPRISNWENSCIGVRLDSLHKLAEAFDVALVVKFVPFSELTRDELPRPADNRVPSFEEDSPEAIRTPRKPIIFNAESNSRIRIVSHPIATGRRGVNTGRISTSNLLESING